jgi:hypothetical protein
MIHGVIAAAVLMAATSPAPAFLGFDARGCAVRYVAMRNLFSYAVDNPEALKSSKTFEQRAKDVMIKAGLLTAGAPLPKAVTDEGAAWLTRWNKKEINDAQVTREVNGCDRANGFTPLL